MLACPRCDKPLPEAHYNSPDLIPCPECHTPIRAEVFPAFFAPPPEGSVGETILVEGESGCFYHPAKRAIAACESCGRFLCALCDLDLNGEHICPACLESGKRKGKLKQLENRRVLYDTVALRLATMPLLVFWLTLITAPCTLYVVIRRWNAPRSMVGRGKWRMVVAGILALLEIAAWVAIFYFITHAHTLNSRSHR